MTIRKAEQNEIDTCVEIARSLEDWFDSGDMVGIEEIIRSHDNYVYDQNGVVGFR